jgi:hypothetical protein
MRRRLLTPDWFFRSDLPSVVLDRSIILLLSWPATPAPTLSLALGFTQTKTEIPIKTASRTVPPPTIRLGFRRTKFKNGRSLLARGKDAGRSALTARSDSCPTSEYVPSSSRHAATVWGRSDSLTLSARSTRSRNRRYICRCKQPPVFRRNRPPSV